MAPVKTYLTAPDFTYKPTTGPIQVGAIIADPFRPTKTLSPPPTDPAPAVDRFVTHDHELTRSSDRSVTGSLFAYFLGSAGGGAGGSSSRSSAESYSIKVLETTRLASLPGDDDEELLRRVAEPRVRAAIRAGLYGRAPVYLVTGVKVARGLAVRTEEGRGAGAGARASVPAAEAVGLTVGGDVAAERNSGSSSSFRVEDGDDVVFAYQLHVVKLRGRKGDRITVEEYTSRAAMLHADDGGGGGAAAELDGLEVGGLADLHEAAEEQGVELETTELVDEEGDTCVCVVVR